MQMMLDIPERVYRVFEQRAESEGRRPEELMIEALSVKISTAGGGPEITYDGPWNWPVIHSREQDSLEFGPEGVYEFIPFP